MFNKINKLYTMLLKIILLFVGPFEKNVNTFNGWFYRHYMINYFKSMSDEDFKEHVRKELWYYTTKKHN